MQHPHTLDRGVTLVEMMVVLAIAAIIIGIGVASLDTHDAKARSAAFTLKTRLMGAKSTAVKLNQDVQVNFNAAEDAYNATTAGGTLLFSTQLENGIDLNSNSTQVTFTPLGTADDDPDVQLVGLSGRSYTISINNVGRIRLQ